MFYCSLSTARVSGCAFILLALVSGLPAGAALYTYSYSDAGPVPQGGTTLSAEHTISGIAASITGIELILSFNDNSSLLGNSGGIQGHLNLGTGSGSPYVNFYPIATSSSGANRVYDVTFSGSSGSPGLGFNGLNPNDTWALVLWDNSTTHFENGLVSWTLDITAVPEPSNTALGIFGALLAGGAFGQWYWKRRKTHRRPHIWPV